MKSTYLRKKKKEKKGKISQRFKKYNYLHCMERDIQNFKHSIF